MQAPTLLVFQKTHFKCLQSSGQECMIKRVYGRPQRLQSLEGILGMVTSPDFPDHHFRRCSEEILARSLKHSDPKQAAF